MPTFFGFLKKPWKFWNPLKCYLLQFLPLNSKPFIKNLGTNTIFLINYFLVPGSVDFSSFFIVLKTKRINRPVIYAWKNNFSWLVRQPRQSVKVMNPKFKLKKKSPLAKSNWCVSPFYCENEGSILGMNICEYLVIIRTIYRTHQSDFDWL